MTLVYLLLDFAWFSQTVQPALSESWRTHSFAPCRALCTQVLPAANAFLDRYGRADGPLLLEQVAAGLSFERTAWTVLVGEVLLFASELAGVDADPSTLCHLLAATPWTPDLPRERYEPIHQALAGTRELAFGGKFYQPHHMGLNNREDVLRLSNYLANLQAFPLEKDRLAHLPPEDCREELEFAQQGLRDLKALYAQAHAAGCIVIRDVL